MPSDDISTSLHAETQRIIDRLMSNIAKEGLSALKQTLDDSGFSEKLKQYEAYSHVAGDSVIFELVVDSSQVIATDAKTVEAIREQESKARQDMMRRVTKTFELGVSGPRRVVRDARRFQSDARSKTSDARVSARDARTPARDARVDRVIENPRGMDITYDGKMSLTLERSSVVKGSDTTFPKGSFQGLMGDFMNRLNKAATKNFSGELEKIIARHLK
jgi:hypothetical protein